MFLGWDGLGLSSFLLVIYYNNSKALNAGLLTVLTNRLGDGFLLLAIFLGLVFHTFSLPLLNLSLRGSNNIILFCLIILGAFTKRAQLPFCAWLPAAIAAPTPVSSLVHSSTLVTAGVYVLIRLTLFLPSSLLVFVKLIGRLTILLAGLRALSEGDMKKIVALSTLSQLGIIIIAVGIASTQMAFFHLIAHAFFKALLFIGVGNLIHASLSYQDLKLIGNFSSSLPFTSAILILAKARLCGLPFFSGFFSKEAILEGLDSGSSSWIFFYLVIAAGIVLTQLYRIRFIRKVITFLASFYSLYLSHDLDIKVNLAIVTLIAPAFLGGSWILRLLIFELPFIVTPPIAKQIIIFSVIISLIFRIILGQGKIKKFHFDPGFNLWLLPLFRGQILTLICRFSGDYNHKYLYVKFIDQILSQALLSTQSYISALWSLSARKIFKLLIVILSLIILRVIYLCILTSLKIQNFTWLHPYIYLSILYSKVNLNIDLTQKSLIFFLTLSS